MSFASSAPHRVPSAMVVLRIAGSPQLSCKTTCSQKPEEKNPGSSCAVRLQKNLNARSSMALTPGNSDGDRRGLGLLEDVLRLARAVILSSNHSQVQPEVVHL